MLKALDQIDRTERQNQMIADAAEMAGDAQSDSKLAGYVVMAMYSDGALRTASWRPSVEEHKVGMQLFQAWARAGLEHNFMASEGVQACYSVLNGEA